MALATETTPAGPIWVGGHLTTLTKDEAGQEYSILWLPDKHNATLREAGRPMVFYYLLDRSRLATDPDGHYRFHLQKFSGVMDPSKNIGAPGYAEIAGGYLNFTTTMKIPEPVLQAARQKLLDRLAGQFPDHPLLSVDGAEVAQPRPIPITGNVTKLHTVSAQGRFGGAGGTGAGPETGESGAQAAGGGGGTGSVPAWGWDLQGAGKGSLNPVGTNAFSAMLGQYPVQLLEGAAESGESNLTIENHLTYNIWSPAVSIVIDGDWESTFKHFSAAFEGDAWITELDVQAQLNELEKQGTLTVEVNYNEAFVDPAEMKKYEDAADTISKQFLDIATGAILEKKPPDVTAAEADAGNSWFPGRSFAVKARYDETSLSLDYEKEINKQVTRGSVQSSSLTGLFDELANDESARDRYFSEVFLEEGFQKVHVIASANANWGDAERPGDPINQLVLQVGYPDSEGNLVWKSTARYRDSAADTELSTRGAPASWSDATKDRVYVFDFTKHDDLENPDEIRVKEIVSFAEHPRVLVDEVSTETTTDQHVLEVRADTTGHLAVGPITIDQPVPNEQVSVLVTLRADDVEDRTMEFSSGDEGPKHWDVWYDADATETSYQYRAEAIVSPNTFGQSSLRWAGDWQQQTGSGPLVVEVPPAPEDVQAKLEEYLG